MLTDPAVHRLGLVGALLLGTLALGQGYIKHRARRPALVGLVGLALMKRALDVPYESWEVALTITGVCVLALAHWLNARAGAARHGHSLVTLHGPLYVGAATA